MNFFDFHAHASLKGSTTNLPGEAIRYNAWNYFKLFRDFFGILKFLKQVIKSQANLTQLHRTQVITVLPLHGIEKAFARSKLFYRIVASNLVSPLHRPLLRKLRRNKIMYFDMMRRDMNHLLDANRFQTFHVVETDGKLKQGLLNVILSVEGAHSFQSVKDKQGEQAVSDSIIRNFTDTKDKNPYRFFYLTLTHLTRQPACVHCFGVQFKLLWANILHDVDFQPNPQKIGLTDLGKEIIRIAYDDQKSKRVLIDIKHMSYVARKQFYKLREGEKWNHIPLIASHIGVTGTKLADARILELDRGAATDGCDTVAWYQRRGFNGTRFNPWTINLFDEDIVEVLKSNGLLGISLDQRILGFGKIHEECMSPLEVNDLGLSESRNVTADYLEPLGWGTRQRVVEGFLLDEEVKEILRYEEHYEPDEFSVDASEKNRLYGDVVIDLDDPADAELFKEINQSHFDYLANNILHIIKVGFTNSFNGIDQRPDVRDCICIGSDLDGLIDPINFPKTSGGGTIDKADWVTADKYQRVKQELILSIERCLPEDTLLQQKIPDVPALVEKIMFINGKNFLDKHL